MYLFEAKYINMINDKERVKAIEFLIKKQKKNAIFMQ